MRPSDISAPAWTRWEKHKHRALIALAILASAGVAAAASNERRMFLLPSLPFALSAIAAPEPTTLRSPILGYLDDGCEPDLDTATGSIARAVDERDCGKDRKRSLVRPAPEVPPSAFFAMPEMPDLTNTPFPVIAELSPDPQAMPVVGGNPFTGPIRGAGNGPPVLLVGVPEPASWTLLIGGFALAGGLLRRRVRPLGSALPA